MTFSSSPLSLLKFPKVSNVINNSVSQDNSRSDDIALKKYVHEQFFSVKKSNLTSIIVPFQSRETTVTVTSSSAFRRLMVQRIFVHLAVPALQS